jgi:lycopene beta-cyclase
VLDVLVVGAGPAGRAVAAACAERGLRTLVMDPAPNRPWRATYGAWRDELPAELPESVLAATVSGRAFAVTEHALNRQYAVLDVPALREHLDQRLAAAGVAVQRGLAHPDELPAAGLVIDAGGAAQPLARARPRRGHRVRDAQVRDAQGHGWAPGERGRPVRAEQTAVGVIVPAELATPVLAPGEALFMDWRQPAGHGGWPTFLYAIPLGGGRVLVEETSLARRPGLDFDTLAARLRARLAGHRIQPPGDSPRELVRFPLDLPRHHAAGVLGFGAAAPLTHPATGYQLAESLRLAPAVADTAAGALGTGPGDALAATQALLWPPSARAAHLLRRRGLETLLRLPPARVPEFFEGFFALPERLRRDYLSGRGDPFGTARAMAGTFGTTGWPVRLRLIGSSLLVSAPPESTGWSNVE